MKEQLYLLKKFLKDKHVDEENSNENTELIYLLRQQNANLQEEKVSKNETLKILTENLRTANKNLYYENVKPKEIYEKVFKKSKTKTNEKSKAEIKYDNHYEKVVSHR